LAKVQDDKNKQSLNKSMAKSDYCIALFQALHCAALHCTALHCTALHCTALHCTALHCTALLCTARPYVTGGGRQAVWETSCSTNWSLGPGTIATGGRLFLRDQEEMANLVPTQCQLNSKADSLMPAMQTCVHRPVLLL
jgi:hypothetical protein